MPSWLLPVADICFVLLLIYGALLFVGDRRTLWMVRGLILLTFLTVLASSLHLPLLSFVLEKLVLGAAVALAVVFQSQLRRFLEQLGRGELLPLLEPRGRSQTQSDTVLDEIVEAVRELSQNRTGALMVLETTAPVDEDRDFPVPGVVLNAEVSKELLQTIFQTSTLLHDGAVFIRGSRLIAAGVILPLSERSASRQLGTRHRAAMGITERVEHCLCIVVSEETGSISLAERGQLNRPLTSSKLRDLLQAKIVGGTEREILSPQLDRLGRQLRSQGQVLLGKIRKFPAPRERK